MLVRDLDALEGLISAEVGARLYELASAVPAEQGIVEIGSYRGKSTCYLAAGSQSGNGVSVVAVDPWDSPGNITGRFGFAERETREAFWRQVRKANLADLVIPLRGFSHQIAAHWLKPIGLLYIDGSHTEADVQRDWTVWRPHLAPGAVVAFDDYRTERNPGVARVVDRLKADPTFGRWEDGPAPLVIGWTR